MAKNSMFFVVETTNGRGIKEQYCIPAKSGASASHQIQNSDLKIETKECLGWHKVSIASQQFGDEIVFEVSINGRELQIYPNSYGYQHLQNQFHEQVVAEISGRKEEHQRYLDDERYMSEHPFG